MSAGNHDSIAAGLLGFVHGSVGAIEHGFSLFALPKLCHTQADRNAYIQAMNMEWSDGDFLADTLGYYSCHVDFGILEHDREFFPAKPSDNVEITHRGDNALCRVTQHVIADQVAMRVVDFLEEIQVGHHHAQGLIPFLCLADLY